MQEVTCPVCFLHVNFPIPVNFSTRIFWFLCAVTYIVVIATVQMHIIPCSILSLIVDVSLSFQGLRAMYHDPKQDQDHSSDLQLPVDLTMSDLTTADHVHQSLLLFFCLITLAGPGLGL